MEWHIVNIYLGVALGMAMIVSVLEAEEEDKTVVGLVALIVSIAWPALLVVWLMSLFATAFGALGLLMRGKGK